MIGQKLESTSSMWMDRNRTDGGFSSLEKNHQRVRHLFFVQEKAHELRYARNREQHFERKYFFFRFLPIFSLVLLLPLKGFRFAHHFAS